MLTGRRVILRPPEECDRDAFLSLNRAPTPTVTAQPAAYVKGQQPTSTKDARREAAAAAKADAERRTKLRKLRTQIDELIKSQGGAWKLDEHPHS